MQKILATLSALAITLGIATAQKPESAVNPQAVEIAERALDFLANQKQFQVNAEIWQTVTIDGTRLEFARNTQVSVRRPDHARLAISETEPLRSFFYDGKMVTVADFQNGFFAETNAPATLDETIEALNQKLGMQFPLEDLLLSRPFGGAAKKALSAQDLGIEKILGTECHHIAFQNAGIHWQAWIQTGPTPAIRKVILVDPNDPEAEQTTILFDQWDFTTELADDVFVFKPTETLKKIEMVPVPETPEIPGERETSVESKTSSNSTN